MSLLNKAVRGRVSRPQKVVIYAPEGFGKSTLASQFPDPLFLDVEGSTAQLDVVRLGRDVLTDLPTLDAALTELAATKPCDTAVVDTIDWLEQMAIDTLVAEANSAKIKGVEDFGYGKGYTFVKDRMLLTFSKFDRLIAAGINVVLLAHSKVTKFEPPDGAGPFDRYEMKLSKHVAPLVKEWCDMLLFGNWRVQIREKDKNEAGAKFKGVGGKERLLHCVRCSAWDAKNRHGMADVEKWDIATIEKAFRAIGAPWNSATAPVAASNGSEGKEETATDAKTALPAASAPVETKSAPGQAESAPGADAELARVCEPHSETITNYLLSSGKIKAGQTWANVDENYRKRILKNPAGFLKVAGKVATK
jgi:hypothetical protein